MRRRRPVQYAPLTSLLDVLFILIFATLVQASTVGQAAPAVALAVVADPAPGPPPLPPDAAALHQRALAALASEIGARRPLIARIGIDGAVHTLERDGVALALGLPLVEPVAEPDVRLRYLGERSADLRLCALIAVRLGRADLADTLIVVAPDVPLADLTVALAAGLRRDVERCAAEQRGVAALVEPSPDRGTP